MVPFTGFLEFRRKLGVNLVMGMHVGDYGPGCRFPWDFHRVQFTEQYAGHYFCVVLSSPNSIDRLPFLFRRAGLEGGTATMS